MWRQRTLSSRWTPSPPSSPSWGSSLYFALAGFLALFHYLKYALAVVLAFVGGKMLLADIYHVSIVTSLGVIAGLLLTAVAASVVRAKRMQAAMARKVEPARGEH